MKIAVVVPCHNAEAWLGQTLGCLLEQTLRPQQIVVVDDASTDGSRAVAEAMAASDPGRFTLVINDEPGSASRARNAGYGVVADDAEAVMFLDADDVLAPDTLAALAGGLGALAGGHGIAMCPWVRVERRSAAVGDEAVEPSDPIKAVAGEWVTAPMSAPRRPAGVSALDAWLTGWYHPPCAVLWSRSAYEPTGGWDPVWCVNDDGHLMLRALVDQTPLTVVGGGLAGYRRLPAGQTSLSDRRLTAEGLASRLDVLRKIGLRLEQAGTLARHRGALTHAIWQVRREAEGVAPSVAVEAETLGRRWSRSGWRRWAMRGRAGGAGGAAYPEVAEPFESQAVTWGLERAAEAMASHEGGRACGNRVVPTFAAVPARPTVSVIVPTYNRPDASERALRSVLGQSREDFEVIVVDDASTDSTAERCRSIHDPRIRVHRQAANGGVARARNTGMRLARGRYLAFLDSDDQWEPTKLERQLAALQALDEGWAMVYCGMRVRSEQDALRVLIPERRGELADALLKENFIQPGGSGPLMRRSAVAAVGFFDESLSAIEDWDYWLRLAQLFRIEVVPEALCVYDDTGDDQADRRSRHVKRNIRARQQFFAKHRDALRRAGLAQAFLWQTVDRCLRPRVIDPAAARRLAWRAVRLDPRRLRGWRMLKWAWRESVSGSGVAVDDAGPGAVAAGGGG